MGEPLLAGRTVVVTGASRGIGAAIARAAAREGARVGLNYHRSRGPAEALARELREGLGARVELLPFDVTDAAAIARACDPLLEGEGRIHGWVNNAGVMRPGLLPTQSDGDLRLQLDVNLLGPLLAARFVIPAMLRARQGAIVNVGSVTASRAARGQAAYAAAKGGVAAMTRALAAEYGRKGIRVNCVEPGPTLTEMLEPTRRLAGDEILERIPMRRFGEPAEIAEAVVFLLSDKASFVNGAVLAADGGYAAG